MELLNITYIINVSHTKKYEINGKVFVQFNIIAFFFKKEALYHKK